MTDKWTKGEFSMWHSREGRHTYLGYTMLIAFRTSGGAPYKVCPYCGVISTNGSGSCIQCGGPLGVRPASMQLRTIMPYDGDVLTTMRPGDEIELHHAYCGRRDDYSNGHQVAILKIADIDGPNFADLGGWHDKTAQDWAEMEIMVAGPVTLNMAQETNDQQ